MSDFCKQCSIEVFGEDFGDMKACSTKEDDTNKLYAGVLCEHCGPCQVDSEGTCITHTPEEHKQMYKDSP